MKKQMKKITSVLLAVAMLLAVMMPALAADGDMISAGVGGTVMLTDKKHGIESDVTGLLIEDSSSPVGYSITGGFDVPDTVNDDIVNAALTGEKDFTIEFWVYPNSLSGAFIGKGNTQFSVKMSGSKLEYCVVSNASKNTWLTTEIEAADAGFKAKQWNHVVVNHDDLDTINETSTPGATTQLYVNGKMVKEYTWIVGGGADVQPNGKDKSGYNGSLNSNGDLLGIGKVEDKGSLDGKMSGAHIYNRVLTAKEVSALYNRSADALTYNDESVVLWYDADGFKTSAGEVTFPVKLSAGLQTSTPTGFSGYAYDEYFDESLYLYATNQGWQPTFSYNAGSNTVSSVTYTVPEGATALTGKITMADSALTSNASIRNTFAWFSTNDGTTETVLSATGPFLRYTALGQGFKTPYADASATQQAEMKDRAFAFTVAIPEGAKTLTFHVSNSATSTWQYATLFDTVFVNDVTVDAAVAAVDQKIAKLADEHNELTPHINNYYTDADAEVVAAKAAYAALTDEQKAQVNGAYALNLMKSYDDIKDSIFYPNNDPRIDGNNYNFETLYNYWIRTCDDETWNTTVDALRDEAFYQYTERNFNVGIAGASANNRFHAWCTNYYYLQMGKADNGETALTAPFPGTAFTLKRDFYKINYAGNGTVGNDEDPTTGNDMLPLSNTFEMDGKTYQVCWNNTGIIENGTATTNTIYPGSGVEATGNAFRKACAEYNQDVKWDGKTLGYPVANATQNGNTVAQAFEGPDGSAYILANADMLAKGEATVVTGDIAETVAEYEGDFFAAAGEFLRYQDGALVFENMLVDANGIREIHTLDITIDNSNAASVLNEDGKYDITWNAKVVLGEETIEEINDTGVKFKAYGAIYGTDTDSVEATAESGVESSTAKIENFAEGDDIDVYTIFGFRLKNVAENKTRAAKFFITYELDGVEHTIYSTTTSMVAEALA